MLFKANYVLLFSTILTHGLIKLLRFFPLKSKILCVIDGKKVGHILDVKLEATTSISLSIFYPLLTVVVNVLCSNCMIQKRSLTMSQLDFLILVFFLKTRKLLFAVI